MSENDGSPYNVTFANGHKEIIQAFSYVFVYSHRKYFGLYRHADLHALMDGHVQAFTCFEGCAATCIYDSQKNVVLRWEGQQPIYTPRFLAFTAYYEYRPRAVRGEPNAKPRVERSFWEAERSFLNGRTFLDFDDMRAQLAHWLDTIVDPRRRHGETSLDRFAREREHLVPLPRHPYDTARVVYRICTIDGFVAWEGNAYAVPYDHITDILPVRITQRELFVYAADLATPRSLDEYVAEQTVRRVADALGEARTTPRDLAEYDRLPGASQPSGAAHASDPKETPCPNDPAAETTRPTPATHPRPTPTTPRLPRIDPYSRPPR